MKIKANRRVLKGALGIGAALALGAGILVASTPKEAVYVLCLHHVAPVPGEDGGMYTSPGEFASLLARLRQGGAAFLSLEEFRRWIEGTGPIPPVSVLLTFDDGYEDNASELMPVLRSFDVPAAVFVVGANVGAPGRLSAPQMRAMAQSGLVTFGSHTQHHRDLRGLSAAQLTEEFAGSRILLEGLLEVSVDVLSYPNGRNGPAIRRMAVRSGYALAFGTEGAPCTRSSDPMNLPRYTPGAFSRALGWRLAIRRLLE